MKRYRCYLIPVGGDSLEFLRVRASKKPSREKIKALRDMAEAAGRMLKGRQLKAEEMARLRSLRLARKQKEPSNLSAPGSQERK